MHLRVFLLPTLLALAALCASSFNPDDLFIGNWSGIITQEIGETTRYFDMELGIAPLEGQDSVYEISSHVMDGDYHAFMAGQAFLDESGLMFVAESEIIRSDSIPDMEWCVKRMHITQSMEDGQLHLRGFWDGDTSFGPCDPGRLDLVQQVARP